MSFSCSCPWRNPLPCSILMSICKRLPALVRHLCTIRRLYNPFSSWLLGWSGCQQEGSLRWFLPFSFPCSLCFQILHAFSFLVWASASSITFSCMTVSCSLSLWAHFSLFFHYPHFFLKLEKLVSASPKSLVIMSKDYRADSSSWTVCTDPWHSFHRPQSHTQRASRVQHVF